MQLLKNQSTGGRLMETVFSIDNIITTQKDDCYVHNFFQGGASLEEDFIPFIISERLQEHINWQILPLERMDLLISSPSMRCAAMTYETLTKPDNFQPMPNDITFQYLGKLYKTLQKSLSGLITIDLIYACYILCKLENILKCSIDTKTNHIINLFKIMQ